MSKFFNNLKIYVSWFNSLNDELQNDILESLYIRNLPILEEESDNDSLKNLRDTIIEMIYEIQDRDKIIEMMQLAGLEKTTAKEFYEFCSSITKVLIDASIIKKMDIDKLDIVVKFIINKAIIYGDFRFYAFNTFVKLGNFINSDEAKKAMRFLYQHILIVCKRELSPDALKDNFKKDLGIQEDLSQVIINNINEKIFEMQQSYLLTQLKTINNKITKLQSSINTNKKATLDKPETT